MYGKLPTEILKLPLDEISINQMVLEVGMEVEAGKYKSPPRELPPKMLAEKIKQTMGFYKRKK